MKSAGSSSENDPIAHVETCDKESHNDSDEEINLQVACFLKKVLK